MGAGASVPEGGFDKAAAQAASGDLWDEAKFDEVAVEGKISAEQWDDLRFKSWHDAQVRASAADPKDTADFKYVSYSECPTYTGLHRSLMSKVVTPEVFAANRDKVTSSGYTFSNAIQTGVMTPHLGVGITAGDEDSWTVFAEVMNPIINGWHNFDPLTQKHTSDLDPSHLLMSDEDVALFNEYVVSTRIRAARNISGFALPPGATDEARAGVEEVLMRTFAGLEGDLAGTYYKLGELNAEQTEDLRSNGFLFQKPKPTNLLTYAGAARSWPNNRGIFHNAERTILCWCNEEDHCRIISMSKDGNVKTVFTNFCRLSHAIKASAEAQGAGLMFSDTLGFLGTCPSNLGTGLRASVMIKLPLLNERVELLEAICAANDLQPRGSAGEHSAAVGGKWDISNKQRIGFSEVELVQKMINGVKICIACEQKLAAGGEVTEADFAPAPADAAAGGGAE